FQEGDLGSHQHADANAQPEHRNASPGRLMVCQGGRHCQRQQRRNTENKKRETTHDYGHQHLSPSISADGAAYQRPPPPPRPPPPRPPPPPPPEYEPLERKQSEQYTGRSPRGLNGTCVSLPHCAQTTSYISRRAPPPPPPL